MSSNPDVLDAEATSHALAVVPDMSMAREPAVVLAEAQKAAKALKDVIDNKPKKVVINGKTHLEIQDWLLVARFYGVAADIEWTRPCTYGDASGWEARAVAKLVSTGQTVSSAESMCMNDEERWTKNPSFQLRSMAQTRAISKALAGALRWVVVLAGYSGTPAEEMGGGTGGTESDGDPNSERLATEGQKKLLHAKRNAAKIKEEDLHLFIADRFKVSSMDQVRFADVNEILAWVDSHLKRKA